MTIYYGEFTSVLHYVYIACLVAIPFSWNKFLKLRLYVLKLCNKHVFLLMHINSDALSHTAKGKCSFLYFTTIIVFHVLKY
jgi:hypothetical protein